MADQFKSVEGDLEQIYVTDYNLIDQQAMTGSLWLWGENSYGRLGDNTRTNRNSPIQTVSGGTNWKLVASGRWHTAGIKTDGTLWTWGYNTNGELGDNTGGNGTHKSSPVQTIAGGTNWKLVAPGRYHTAAIKTDGTLWTWGRNDNSQLGDNSITKKSSPVQTVAGGTNWKLVAGGFYHTAAIKTDGTLWTWGENTYGTLGDDTGVAKSSPVQTVAGGTNWKQVAGGNGHTAAIKTDGTLWLWGYNNYGKLGTNTEVIIHPASRQSSPVQTVSGGTNWKQVALGKGYSSAIKTDGTLWLWGQNDYGGYLGDNTRVHKSSPVQTIAAGTNWKQVASGDGTTAAIKTDGTLWNWGINFDGRLGNGNTSKRSSPVQTAAGGTNWKSLAGGTYCSAAIHFYEAGNLYPSS